MTPRYHSLRIAEVRPETPECISVKFDLPPELAPEYRFVQGQHIGLRATLDGEELRRSYSICSGSTMARFGLRSRRSAAESSRAGPTRR